MNRILLVEDDEVFGSLLKNYLEMSNYSVDWSKDGAKGYSQLSNQTYDLCILDVMMPNMDGFTLGKKINERQSHIPFIYLTARGQKEDILKGYKIGAADYLSKPFDVEILLHKIKVLMQKEVVHKPEKYAIGNYNYERKTRTLSHPTFNKRLSPKEAQLLELLLQEREGVLERSKALVTIWNEDSYFTKRSMDVYIAKLRKYLSQDESILLETLPNLGFSLKVRD